MRKDKDEMRREHTLRRTKALMAAVLSTALLGAFLPLAPAAQASGNQGLQLNGSSQHATLGSSGQLNVSQFTLELWFNRTGSGATTTSGSGGVTAVPLIAKGRGEAEMASVDVNYFFGIDASNHLVADFEEPAGAGSSPNYPIIPTTSPVVTNNAWHHAAATYDGQTWHLYLDGNDAGSLTLPAAHAPASSTTTLTSVGTALTSPSGGGVAEGRFQGVIDEVRIWNTARSQAEIQASKDSPIGPTAGLMGAWHLDEGSGTTAADASGNNIAGALVGSPARVAGAPALGPSGGTGNYGIRLNGANSVLINTGGSGSGPNPSTYTIELWFNWNGGGTTTSTGSGGVTAYPLVTKGRSEIDMVSMDVNYFLGIDTGGHLVADFEQFSTTGGGAQGQNRPTPPGSTTITPNAWHHAAASYSTAAGWSLYLDGVSQIATPSQVGFVPNTGNTSPASVGSAYQSAGTGTANGFFAGDVDELRIWNVVRSQAQIQASMNTELTSGTGLIDRWGMNENTGTTAVDSVGSSPGALTNGPTWVPGAPALGSAPTNDPPNTPVVSAPSDGETGVNTSPTLDVAVSDPNGDPMDVSFYGHPLTAQPPGDFTIGTLPDTQFYSQNTPSTRFAQYLAQTQWYVDTRAQLNTVFVTHLGDITQTQDTIEAEWQRASQAQATMDNAGLPNSVVTGNHDIVISTGNSHFFDQYFSPSRYLGNAWYGGYQGYAPDGIADVSVDRLNKNNYELFDVGTLKFLMISLEVDMPQFSVQWAQNVINAYPDRRVIITTHSFLTPSGTRATTLATGRPDATLPDAVFSQLISPNCNIFLVINGHFNGEASRTDTNACGKPVHQVVVDYQGRINGGDGWLRYMTFRPALNQIDSYSYSPTLNQYETDSSSQFTIPYDMGSNPVQLLGTVNNVSSGSHANLQWTGLAGGTQYEWYAVANDGTLSAQSPNAIFTTSGSVNQPPVVDSVAINQGTPQTNDTLSVAVTAHDPENSALSYTYQWRRNGADILGANGSTLNLSGANNGNKGDQITVRVTANDGSLQSAPMTSSSVTVQNTPPTSTVALNTSTPADNSILTSSAARADVDNDAVTLTYVWKVNGVTKKTTLNSSSTNDTFDLSVAGNGDTGDQVTVTVTPNDGTASGAESAPASATIGAANTRPVATDQDVIVRQNTATAITMTATDANNDPITYSMVTNPLHGTLTGTGAVRTYTPTTGYQGPDTFTFRGSDAGGAGNTATIRITIAKAFALTITNSGFSKANQGVKVGSTVTWTNSGPGTHTATDGSTMGLFDSGLMAVNGTYAFTFVGSGNYTVRDSQTGNTMRIKVPVNLSQGSGDLSTVFVVTWAGAPAPAGYVWDVQIKRKTAAWTNWNVGVSTLKANYTADNGTGTYKFRARLHRTSNNATSAWSGAKAIQVV
jgi:plastocyanin